MVHALHVERIERQILADRQVAMLAVTTGAQGVEMPDVYSAWAEFEAALVAESQPVTPEDIERHELLLALGLVRE